MNSWQEFQHFLDISYLDPFFCTVLENRQKKVSFLRVTFVYQKLYCPNETFLVIFRHRDTAANRDNMQKGSLLVKIAAN